MVRPILLSGLHYVLIFNLTQIHEIAQAISTEARALHNQGIGGLDFWAPNIKYAKKYFRLYISVLHLLTYFYLFFNPILVLTEIRVGDAIKR